MGEGVGEYSYFKKRKTKKTLLSKIKELEKKNKCHGRKRELQKLPQKHVPLCNFQSSKGYALQHKTKSSSSKKNNKNPFRLTIVNVTSPSI